MIGLFCRIKNRCKSKRKILQDIDKCIQWLQRRAGGYVNKVLKKGRRTKGSAENKRFRVENEEIQNLAAER
jgi:hypothetical protein